MDYSDIDLSKEIRKQWLDFTIQGVFAETDAERETLKLKCQYIERSYPFIVAKTKARLEEMLKVAE